MTHLRMIIRTMETKPLALCNSVRLGRASFCRLFHGEHGREAERGQDICKAAAQWRGGIFNISYKAGEHLSSGGSRTHSKTVYFNPGIINFYEVDYRWDIFQEAKKKPVELNVMQGRENSLPWVAAECHRCFLA